MPSDHPFLECGDALERRVAALSPRAAAGFFCCAGLALTADGFAGADAETWPAAIERTLHAARAFAVSGRAGADLDALREDGDGFDRAFDHSVRAADAWCCARAAGAGARGEPGVADQCWSVLEPVMQATMRRLHGVDEAEIEDEPAWETAALADPVLAAAVAAAHEALDLLAAAPEPGERELLRAAALLAAVRP